MASAGYETGLQRAQPSPDKWRDAYGRMRWTLYATFEDLLYAQVPYLQRSGLAPGTDAGSLSESEISLAPYNTVNQKYTLDAAEYVEDRFPKPLQDYVARRNLPLCPRRRTRADPGLPRGPRVHRSL